jgi:predicted Zn-dependent peptidase
MAFKGTETIGTEDYAKELPLLEKLEELMHSETEDRNQQLEEVYAQLAEVWKDNEFSKLYKEQGAVGLNAGTGKDFTYYTVELPNSAFEFWCWMESDRLLNPVFRQFYKERKVIREERRFRTDDNPGGKLYEQLLATAFLTHPNRLPTIGWPSDMENLSRKQMKEFYNTYYRPDNMVISLVGDLERSDVENLIEKYFARFPKRSDPLPQILTKEEPQVGPRSIKVEFDAKPKLLMGYHKPVYPHRDDLHFAIMHSLLSDGASSLLHKELVLEKRIASSVYTSEAPGERYPSLFIVGGVPREHVSVDKFIQAIQDILDRLKHSRVSAKLVDAAKRRVQVSFLEGLTSNSGIAYLLGKNEVLWGDWKVLLEMYDVMTQTTAEDIQRLAKTYFQIGIRTDARIIPLGQLAASIAPVQNDSVKPNQRQGVESEAVQSE